MTTWHGLLWLCLRQHPSEASVKISSESDLFGLFLEKILEFVCYYFIWSGLRQYPCEGSVKVSSRFDLFWMV